MVGIQSVQKLGPLLDLFTADRPEWGVSEVAAALGLPRSSAHALLSSLADIGLLRCRRRGRYRIGWRVVELSEALRGTNEIQECAAPALDRLVERYGETTHLAVMERSRVLYVDKVLGTHNISVRGARVGARLEAHCTAVGKVLLAQHDDCTVRRMIAARPLRRLTASTITDPDALLKSLREIRDSGVAIDQGEAMADVHCVAAPVRDDLGFVVAAVSMSVPAHRFVPARAELTRAVQCAAREISRAVAESGEAAAPDTRDGVSALVPELYRQQAS